MSSVTNVQNNPDQKGVVPQTDWWNTELVNRIAGVALVVLGVGLFAGAVAGIVLITPPLPLGIALGFAVGEVFSFLAFIPTIAFGILFLNKDCWEDPAFVEKHNEKAKEMSLEEIQERYRGEIGHLSNEMLVEKFVEVAKSSDLEYVELARKYPVVFSIKSDRLKSILKEQVEAKKLTIEDLLMLHPDLCNESWLPQAFEEQIRGKPIDASKWEEGFSFQREAVKKELRVQLEEKGFEAFMKNRTDRYTIVYHELIPMEILQDCAKKAVAGKSVKEIVNLYGWGIFGLGILKGKEYRAAFESEAEHMDAVQIRSNYGTELIQTDITTRKFLESRVDNCQSLESIFGPSTTWRYNCYCSSCYTPDNSLSDGPWNH